MYSFPTMETMGIINALEHLAKYYTNLSGIIGGLNCSFWLILNGFIGDHPEAVDSCTAPCITKHG